MYLLVHISCLAKKFPQVRFSSWDQVVYLITTILVLFQAIVKPLIIGIIASYCNVSLATNWNKNCIYFMLLVRVLGGQRIFLLKLENQNRESSIHSFFDLILKVEKWENSSFFVCFIFFQRNEKQEFQLIFVFRSGGEKCINSLNIRFLRGWELNAPFCWLVSRRSSAVPWDRSPPLLQVHGFLMCLLHLIFFSSNNQTNE